MALHRCKIGDALVIELPDGTEVVKRLTWKTAPAQGYLPDIALEDPPPPIQGTLQITEPKDRFAPGKPRLVTGG